MNVPLVAINRRELLWSMLLIMSVLLFICRPRACAQIYQEIYSFPATDMTGFGPRGSLVEATDGNLYGTTMYGGQPTTNCPVCGYGTVFRMTPSGAFTTIAWFNVDGANNGAYPFGQMLQASDGNFYGDSEYGLFRVTGDGVLTGRGGGAWAGDPIQGSDGFLYYVNDDTIFRSPLNWAPGTDWTAPGTPSGGLIQAFDGNFYGVTSDGGADNIGTVYRLTLQGALSIAASFYHGVGNAKWPYGRLLQASDGNFYGIAGPGDGTVFRMSTNGTLTTVALFDGYVGFYPNGGLIEARDGNFYGTAPYGGNPSGWEGTVFRMTREGVLSLVVSFTGQFGAHPGASPYAGVIQASDGNLYGTCGTGGSRGGGNIFRILMPGPQLYSVRASKQLILSWRTNYTGFVLESTGDLQTANWTACTNLPAVVGQHYFVTNNLADAPAFFRLRK